MTRRSQSSQEASSIGYPFQCTKTSRIIHIQNLFGFHLKIFLVYKNGVIKIQNMLQVGNWKDHKSPYNVIREARLTPSSPMECKHSLCSEEATRQGARKLIPFGRGTIDIPLLDTSTSITRTQPALIHTHPLIHTITSKKHTLPANPQDRRLHPTLPFLLACKLKHPSSNGKLHATTNSKVQASITREKS